MVAGLLVPPSEARGKAWEISGGVVDTDFDTGMNITAGYAFTGKRFRVSLNFVDWNVYFGEAEGFRRETLSNGTEICRDLSNGQFANNSACDDTDLDIAGSITAGYVLKTTKPLFLGVGARIGGDDDLGGDDTVFGVARLFGGNRRLYAQLLAAPDYAQLSFGVAF